MNNPVKVAVIGPGLIAKGAHIPHYQNDPRTEVIAVSSHSMASAKEAAEETGVPGYYDDPVQMLEAEKPDLVSVCSPNASHFGDVMAALKAGCHVLCEKPPGVSPLEAVEMEQAAKASGKHLLYGFQNRFNPASIVLKRAVEAGELGFIYHVNVTAMRRRGIPSWGSYTDPSENGGGPLMDVGVHMIDLAMYLTGFPRPVEVMGVTHRRLGQKPGVGLLGAWDPKSFQVEDLATGLIRFENGMSMSIQTSYAGNIEKDEHLNVELLGDRGGAETNPFTLYQEKYGALFDAKPAYLDESFDSDSHARQIRHFIDLTMGKAKPVNVPREGTAIQQIIEALYLSASSKQSVSLAE